MEPLIAALSSASTTLANGVLSAGSVLLSPVTISVAVIAASLVWMAGIEIEELTRQGTKLNVQLH